MQVEQETKPNTASSPHRYAIKRIPIDDPEYISETPPHLQNKDLPGFPSTIIAVGPPGSGKSNVLFNLLTREEFWKGFFDIIYEIGPTVNADKLFKSVKIPDDQKVDDPKEIIPKLVEWVDKQKMEVKNNSKNAPKCLFIFEDITALRDTIQNSEEFIKCWTAIRHHKSTSYANIHKLTGLHRTCRISSMHILMWPCPHTEVKQAHHDFSVADLDYHDFLQMCKFAWKPEEGNEKPFLYINRYAPEEKRFRKCFYKIIDWSQFIGLGRRLKRHQRKKEQKYETLGRQPYPSSKPRIQPPPPTSSSSSSSSSSQSQSQGQEESESVRDNVLMYLK